MPATSALSFQHNFESNLLVSNAVPANFTAEPVPHCCGPRVETKEAREGMPAMLAANDTVLGDTTPVSSGVLAVALRAETREETGGTFNGRVQLG